LGVTSPSRPCPIASCTTPSGCRFLINLIAAEQAAPITLIYNWTTLLQKPS
jgi:hypothetical protein